jgi:hypothetical protein
VEWAWENSQKLGELGTASGFLLTIFVVALGVWQYFKSIQIDHEASAKALYAEYQVLAFENPEFANPSLAAVDYDAKTFDGDRLKFEKYEWFVGYMETMAEEIFALSNRTDWNYTLQEQLGYHQRYFASSHYEESGYFRNVTPEIAEMLCRINPNLRRPPNG